jgi:hypothetical protein
MALRAPIAAALAAALIGAGNAAASPAPSFVTANDCQEHQAFVQGDSAAVAAKLPKPFSAVMDPATDSPIVFVRALNCAAVGLGGTTAPATMASYGIVVDSPDGSGCASASPLIGAQRGDVPPMCNWYALAWLSTDQRIVDWLRATTPEFPAYRDPGLSLELGGFDPAKGGAPMHFDAPPPSPSAFSMDEVGRPRPGTLAVRGSYFNRTPSGTVRVRFSTPDLTSGDANGTVRAAPGSELAQIMGATERPYLAADSGVSAEHWDHAAYRKQVESEADHGFSGSCSVHGTVRFSPPATNTDQSLAYDYDASGSCKGVPVALHDSGTAYGGCASAVTRVPGSGTLTFAGGSITDYTLDFSFNGTEGDMTLYGTRAGAGSGHASFLTQETDPATALRCGSDGVSQIPLDWSFSTQGELVSASPPTASRARRRARRCGFSHRRAASRSAHCRSAKTRRRGRRARPRAS